MEKTKVLNRRIHIPQARDNGVVNSVAFRTPEGLRRIRGSHTSYVQPPEWTGSRQQHPSLNTSGGFNTSGTHYYLPFIFLWLIDN